MVTDLITYSANVFTSNGQPVDKQKFPPFGNNWYEFLLPESDIIKPVETESVLSQSWTVRLDSSRHPLLQRNEEQTTMRGETSVSHNINWVQKYHSHQEKRKPTGLKQT